MNKKDGCITSKTLQGNSLWLAVKPPPFDKGGKFSARRRIVRFSGDSAILGEGS